MKLEMAVTEFHCGFCGFMAHKDMDSCPVCNKGNQPPRVYPTSIYDQYLQDKKDTRADQKCLHDSCPECHGTGVKSRDGSICVHMISCPCRRCSPFSM